MGEIRVKTADGWQALPSHQKTSTGWKDIPTHTMTATGWQGELTSQSPLKFRATGQSLLDWRIAGKTSGNLCERYTPVETAQQYSVSLYMFADIQPSTTYTIAFEIDEGSLQYFNENLFTYSQYYVTGTGNKQMLQLNAKTNIQKTASTWSDTYGWIIAKNYTRNATVPHWKKIQLLKGTYTPSTIPPYEPYGGVGERTENLFDVKHFVDTAYCHNVVLTQLDNGIRIQATSSNDPYANYVNGVIGQTLPVNMRNAVIPCKSNIDYTFRCAQSSRIGKYISYFDKDYKVVKNYTPFSGTSINFKTPETCVYILLRIGDSSTLSEGTTIELTDIQILEGTYTTSTIPPYEPYGYKIPVNVRGDNLYSSAWEQGFWSYDTGSGWSTDSKYVRTAKMPCEGNTKYEFVCSLPDGSKDYGFVFWDTNGHYIGSIYSSNVQNTPVKYSVISPKNAKRMAVNIARYSNGERHPVDILGFDLYELHETNLFTDHQLMDGDSIDFTTDQTQIPIATGNNTLTVDTAVQPKSVFVKFEG